MQLNTAHLYLAIEPVDMRLGMDGLSRLAQDHRKQNIGNGCCYVFSNKAHTRLKALLWDGTGVWLCQRRLHQGRFTWPDDTSTLFELSKEQWGGLLKEWTGNDWALNRLMIGVSKKAF